MLRTVKDLQTGQNVVLSDKDLEFVKRIQSGKIPDSNFDNFAPWIDWFSSDVMDTPLRSMPPSKTSFLPSKIDKMKISKMVHAIKMGWMKPKPKPSTEPNFYMLWESDDKADEMRRVHDHIPAPKVRLPSNAESYNPPSEYLFDEKEMKDWDSKDDEPWKRRYNFIPQKYKSLREVPAYDNYTRERFQRCLDLYLCPRAKKMRLTIKAEDLVPQLPNPKDLQPFPTICSMIFKGHSHMVRSITLEPHGQFFASGSEDGTVKVWEIATGRCMKTFEFGCVIRWVEWCPNKSLSLLAVAADSDVMLINPGVGDKLIIEKTDLLLSETPDQGDYHPSERVKGAVQWEPVDEEKWSKGIRILIRHFKNVNQVTWHAKGDYFASVMSDGQNRSVLIHQLSSRRSQLPLNRSKGLIQCVLFHPIRPIFFIATQRHVRVYDLLKQEMVKKLISGAKWISSMSIHPGGDNVIVGTYDKKVMWFDLDLSTKPYQTLRFHGNAVRSVAFHKRYPLFASGSDDCNLIISHGMVYNDLLQNPLIVPVKKLRGHDKFSDFGILSIMFHNMQPWVFSSGADKTIRLYT
ncbi:Ribosome biogenesis protein BOP1 [Orchesella cincta]|uniref:Ribosome biogenesis protein BOP1 homolog n=1 Tax=Orchesella cincta TaxID=48709 RepID=A0A1D2MV61_ORCCI|nr:Ribosome biogenesis protein BOP1 [Orchesella cincta]